jgi:hypothetical protein
MLHKAGLLLNAHETKQQLATADKITDVAELYALNVLQHRKNVTLTFDQVQGH